MKPALALEPVHWQGEVVGQRLAVLALKDGRPTKERAGENRCGRRARPRGQESGARLKERYRNDKSRNLELLHCGDRPFFWLR